MRKRHFRPFSHTSAIKMSLTISVILNAILLLGYIHSRSIGIHDVIRLTYSFLTDVVLFYLLFIFNFRVIQQEWRKSTRFWIIGLGSFIPVIALSLFFTECAILFLPATSIPANFQIVANLIKDLIVDIIVLLSTFLLFSLEQRQKALLENEKLIAENIRIRYEALKNQVDPHFLFNTLNTLDGLIGVDDDKAHDYLQNLSQVFRYAIGNKEILTVDEELNFTESYADLMKIRYGENLRIVYNIDEKYRTWYIMPISLQLLVENAIKHNVISNRHPLIITIETTPKDTIKVLNTIHLKQVAEPGTGVGLANLSERYSLLLQKEIMITITDVFCVELPLIKDLETTKDQNKITLKNESCYC